MCGVELNGFELSDQEPPSWFTPACLREEDARPLTSDDADEALENAESRKKEFQLALLEWRQDFQNRHGRVPTREDMLLDPDASVLFANFQKLSQLDWPEEMKGGRF